MDKSGWISVVSCLLLFLLAKGAQCMVIYVTPNSSADCPDVPAQCKTLADLVFNSSNTFLSNTTLHFLAGLHLLDTPIFVHSVDSVALKGSPDPGRGATVLCSHPAYLRFTNSSNIALQDLELINCGIENILEATLQFDGIVNIDIERLTFNNSSPIDIYSHNVANMTITDCLFGMHSDIYLLLHCIRLSFDNNATISRFNSIASSTVRIKNSSFCNTYKGIIHIDICSPEIPVTVFIDNVTSVGGNKHAEYLLLEEDYQAAILVEMTSTLYHRVEITNSLLLSSAFRAMIFMLNSNGSVLLRNCAIVDSTKGALALYLKSPDLTSLTFIIEDSNISNSRLVGDAGAGSALFVGSNERIVDIRTQVIVRNCVFYNNVNIHSLGLIQSTVYLANVINAWFSDCVFHSNLATAILAARSTVYITGTVEFFNNTGYEGGALGLHGSSLVSLTQNNTYINFTQNSASNVGGAIFVREHFVPYTQPFRNPCFLTVEESVRNNSLIFINNTAVNGGNSVYGESIENCSNGDDDANIFAHGRTNITFVPDMNTDISVTSSRPSRVCVCKEGKPDCTLSHFTRQVIRGESFNLSLVTVGQTFGAATGSVYASFLLQESNRSYYIDTEDQVQHTVASQCRDISFHTSSSGELAILALTTRNVTVPYLPPETLQGALIEFNTSRLIREIILYFPIYVNVSYLPCPLGSVFSEHSCQCDQKLLDNGAYCDISNQTVIRPGNLWVNASFNGRGEYVGIIVHVCRLQYCLARKNELSLENPNEQCAFSRAGILCGGCQEGLSLTLGSPTCCKCSNNFLSLLVFFAAAGIALILFIKFLNLTVSDGTINGLIFYANIVWVNRFLFFDASETSFTSVFIAWLNLDFGIKSCFYDGLDTYSVTWLQYVFPAYIWLLAILFIVLAHYSSLMAKLFGNNAVPVLATLFLLTYNKILRIIVNSFNLTRIYVSEGASKLVWTYDGNLEFLASKHSYLFVAALFVLLVAWLPFTVGLLFGPCFMKLKYYRLTSKLKPFLDAYYGPLLDTRYYWVGVLLVLRSIILFIFALNPQDTQPIHLLVILLTGVVLLYILTRWGYVYKNKYKAQLEASFFLNLVTLAGVQMYIELAGEGRRAPIDTSVFIVFIKFLGILIFQVYRKLRRFGRVQNFEMVVKTKLPQWKPSESQVEPVATIRVSDSLRIENIMPRGSVLEMPSFADGDNTTTHRFLTRRWWTARMRRNFKQQKAPPTNSNNSTGGSGNSIGFSVVGDGSINTTFHPVQEPLLNA